MKEKYKKKLTAAEKGALFADQIAKRFLSILSYSGAKWVKEWRGPSMAPFNGISQKKYRGVNQFMLALVAMSCGYNDPRWFTFIQIADYKGIYHKDKKWHLKEDSKGVYVQYYFPYDKIQKKNLTWSEYYKLLHEQDRKPEEFYFKTKYNVVFNAEQIEGVDPYVSDVSDLQTSDSQPNEKVLDLAQKMEVGIAFDGGDRAFYLPSEDSVHLPKTEHFFSSVAWASTTLHELVHASGAKKRLNRPGIVNNIRFSDEEYAFEELISEIGSCLLCYNLGIEESEENIRNHEAYVASWVKHIEEKPEALTKAIKEAQKAVNYMTGLLDTCDSPPVFECEEVEFDVA